MDFSSHKVAFSNSLERNKSILNENRSIFSEKKFYVGKSSEF